MIEELANLLPNFPGSPNRCHCFLHVVNLIAKSLLKQFEVPNKTSADAALDRVERELVDLASGIDMEEIETVAELGAGGDTEGNDDVEGWVDETLEMSAAEREALRENILRVHLVLVKVSSRGCLNVNTHRLSALQTCIQDHSFDNEDSASMVCVLGQIEYGSQRTSAGCFHSLEFHI